MAVGNGGQLAVPENLGGTSAKFSRVFVQLVNDAKLSFARDFPTFEYIANRRYMDELEAISDGLLKDGVVKTSTGRELDASTVGGAIGLQIYMETLTTSKDAMLGLVKLGITMEKNVWKNL